ncbi:hypothetical protein J6E39_09315 [bacterium]|nr:hypothetical protein [bacterium]
MIIKKKIKKPEVIEEKQEAVTSEEPQQDLTVEKQVKEEEIDLFNLDNIDFKQRQERRRGDRRRGFRRVDDRNLISRAREEAVSIRESAAKEGYQEGLSKAEEDLAELRNSLSAFMNSSQEVFDYIAPNLLEIGIDIAKKIIKKEIEQDPNLILESIKDILNNLSREEKKVTLRVNPSQVDMLKQEIPDVLTSLGLDARVMVVPDENVFEGGCMVVTNNGIIDATIETQLSIISEALREI